MMQIVINKLTVMTDNLQGIEGMSETAISFHYLLPDEMYILEYLVYHFQAFSHT